MRSTKNKSFQQPFPKSKIKVLLLENVHPQASKLLASEGYSVEIIPSALSETQLIKKISNVSILGIRSKTKISKKVLKHAKRLLAIGAFCVGTDQIDLKACSQKGIAVFNAPFSSGRSVAELTIANIISLNRHSFNKSMLMHQKKWNKDLKNSFEVRGKKLGIVGYGNIGSQVSVLAESLGMDVYFYDKVEKQALGNASSCNTLTQLLRQVDIVTVHVDGRAENKKLMTEKEFKKMKTGAFFLNLSRGFVVDLRALAKYLKRGELGGAAIDVFPKEPEYKVGKFVSILQGLPNVILTPHIGGNTAEAQKSIGKFVAKKIISFINTGSTDLSANLPNLVLPKQNSFHRLIHIHKNQPGVLAQINNLLLEHNINIEAQFLKTDLQVGYLITDINKKYSLEIFDKLKQDPATIKLRVLY